MFPPPMTTAISTPVSLTPFTCPAMSLMVSGSIPYPSFPMRASPLSLRRILLYAILCVDRLSQLVPDESPHHYIFPHLRDQVFKEILDGYIRVLYEGLLEEAGFLVEFVELPVGDLVEDLLGLARFFRLYPVNVLFLLPYLNGSVLPL